MVMAYTLTLHPSIRVFVAKIADTNELLREGERESWRERERERGRESGRVREGFGILF